MERRNLREFLEIPYDTLEEMNLEAKKERLSSIPAGDLEEKRRQYLTDEKRIKAVTVAFVDLEGRLHMLDYDKRFLLKSCDNLTFDGSSIRGFSTQHESDLRLTLDWTAFYWLPADFFGPGKVLAFAEVRNRDGSPYAADFRAKLKQLSQDLHDKDGTEIIASTEIEGLLFSGRDAEQHYVDSATFEFVSTGGYFHSLPQDPLRQFIDVAAEVQRAMGFENEKDHPEVAPSQFELNFSCTQALVAADQVLLYKLLCRQVADSMGLTACFLPKPVMNVNGNGMHTNLSLRRDGTNLFYASQGRDGLSDLGWQFVERILHAAPEISLVLNPSVNAYRRLDPAYEAPNQIKASAIDRGSMVRIPLGTEQSARIEVRSVAPDANPYMLFYTLVRTGMEGESSPSDDNKRPRTRFLPSNIYDAIRSYKNGKQVSQYLGEAHSRFAELKRSSADRCPRALGHLIKRAEIQFHHEVTNQILWNRF